MQDNFTVTRDPSPKHLFSLTTIGELGKVAGTKPQIRIQVNFDIAANCPPSLVDSIYGGMTQMLIAVHGEEAAQKMFTEIVRLNNERERPGEQNRLTVHQYGDRLRDFLDDHPILNNFLLELWTVEGWILVWYKIENEDTPDEAPDVKRTVLNDPSFSGYRLDRDLHRLRWPRQLMKRNYEEVAGK